MKIRLLTEREMKRDKGKCLKSPMFLKATEKPLVSQCLTPQSRRPSENGYLEKLLIFHPAAA